MDPFFKVFDETYILNVLNILLIDGYVIIYGFSAEVPVVNSFTYCFKKSKLQPVCRIPQRQCARMKSALG